MKCIQSNSKIYTKMTKDERSEDSFKKEETEEEEEKFQARKNHNIDLTEFA